MLDRTAPPAATAATPAHQLALAARLRGLLDDGHSLASAEAIVGLQDELASARADADRAAPRDATATGDGGTETLGGYGSESHARQEPRATASVETHPTTQHGYIHRKDDYLKRLRRIEGQARGLQRMVEDEKYCIDILTQVSAMTKALQSVALGLLEEHLSHCVVDAAARRRPRGRGEGPRGLRRHRPPGPFLIARPPERTPHDAPPATPSSA